MSFHEDRFPTAISFGSTGGPMRRTEIITLKSGAEERNTAWSRSRRQYDAGLGVRSLDDLADLVAFFEARMGQLHGFRFKDWTDYKSCQPSGTPSATDQDIGTGDGVTTTFQLVKNYASGGASYVRDITKPVSASVTVAIDGGVVAEGTDYTLDATTGVVTFAAALAVDAAVTAGFEFDVPVRFNVGAIETSAASFEAGEIPSVQLVEVRV